MKKYLSVLPLSLLLGLCAPLSFAFAHAIVSPNQAGIGAVVSFSLGVPSEKPMATNAVRLVIPAGVAEVTPFVKPGWTIAEKKDGDTVTEIGWSGGSIPADEQDAFMFSAQVPAQAGQLDWKAYQTYSDGSIVSWDQDPKSLKNPDDDLADIGPYSVTTVINDLTQRSKISLHSLDTPLAAAALTISIVALAAALYALKK